MFMSNNQLNTKSRLALRVLQVTAAAGAIFAAGGGSFASAAIVSSDVDTSVNKLEVYAMAYGANGNEIQQFVNGGASTPWTYHQVTGGAGSLSPSAPRIVGSSVPSYVNTIYNGNELFYLTNDGGVLHVEQLWGSQFSPTDLTAATRAENAAPPSNALMGYIDSVADTDNVFYVGVDQDVHALLWSPGLPWSTEDVNKAVSPAAPPTVPGSVLVGHIETACGQGSQSEEIFYFGTDSHVHELWRWSAHFDGWHHEDVTQAAGAPLAESNSAGTPLVSIGDSFAGRDVVFYVGSDSHVHELAFSCASSTWSTLDLTSKYQVPPVGAGSMFAAHVNGVSPSSPSEELYYLGQGGQVYQLWAWSLSSMFDGWHIADVSGAAAAPNAASASPLSVDIDPFGGRTQDEVYYVGVDDHVHQLYNNAGWTHVDVTAQTGAPVSTP